MERENFQLNTLYLLDALVATLNFRPRVECPPELRGRLSQLQIAIGAHFCAGPQSDDDCGWNCRYVGTEKCNYKCRYSCVCLEGTPGAAAAGAFDSTDKNETDLTAQDLRRELVALRTKVQKFCRRHKVIFTTCSISSGASAKKKRNSGGKNLPDKESKQ